MPAKPDLAGTILDTALQLAEERSWERLRLRDIADALGISLDAIRRHYAQKDDLVEAWFDRADAAMLKTAESPALIELDMPERLHQIIMSWLDALAAHRKVTRDMLLYKLEPAHVHLQVLGLLRVSRTVQWFREAARQDSTHLRRIAEEIGLTSLYLATFVYWMYDTSANQQRTRRLLAQRLRRSDTYARGLLTWLPGQASSRHSPPPRPSD